jgi:hypothetical protein
MVGVTFSACPRVPVGSPGLSAMALEDVGVVSLELKESSMEPLDPALVDE